MHAVVRADAGPQIGGGHVQRCLALAGALVEQGWHCSFAFREETAQTVPALTASGHGLIELSANAEDEPQEIASRLSSGCDLVVVDHYGRGETFETACRTFARRVFALDDQPVRKHDADFLLDATPRSPESVYAPFVPSSCRLLIGPQYALLRPQFAKARPAALARRTAAAPKRLLVSIGMTDPGNLTAEVLRGVAASGLSLTVDVVLGSAAPHLQAVRALIGELKLDARLHVDVTDMAALMAEADLAIGASGASSFERCCLGLPSLIVVAADNQSQFAQALVAAGAVASLTAPLTARQVATALAELAKDGDRRQEMSQRAAALCDGEGARRVAQLVTAVAAAN